MAARRDKIDIWNCFRDGARFRQVLQTIAVTALGRHVIGYWLSQGWLEAVVTQEGEYYRLTAVGQAHLADALRVYIERHPERERELAHWPPQRQRPRPSA